MLFFISEPSMDPHSLQNKVLGHSPSPPYRKSTLQPPLLNSTMFWGQTTTFWVFLLATFSLCMESHCPTFHVWQHWHLLKQNSEDLEVSTHPLPSALWFTILLHHPSQKPPCDSSRSASAKWGLLRGKDSFWCVFASPSPLSRFPLHREHSNICWKTVF